MGRRKGGREVGREGGREEGKKERRKQGRKAPNCSGRMTKSGDRGWTRRLTVQEF